MPRFRTIAYYMLLLLFTVEVVQGACGMAWAQQRLLNASFDPTRRLYREINRAFLAHWQATHPLQESVVIQQSHGGSAKQARAVMDGLKADVVTLALSSDIDAIAQKSGLIAPDWALAFPHNSTPYSSTIVFLVRKGNPQNIRDWRDLTQKGLTVMMPNPRTSGGARWNYLAAWAWGMKNYQNDEKSIKDFMTALYANVPVLDTSARAATTSFAARGLGDVLVGWESDAWLALQEFGSDQFEIITPSLSIKAATPVAVVTGNAIAHGTKDLAEAYLSFLYTDEGQKIIAQNYFRPLDLRPLPIEVQKYFAPLAMVTVEGAFGGWAAAQKQHFDEGALFDQIYKAAHP